MSPKPRSPVNKGVPTGWRWKHGAWRYRVPSGLEHLWDGKREFTLGASLPQAYKVWAQRVGEPASPRTLAAIMDRYAAQILPTKAPKTRASYSAALRALRPVFGHMHPGEIKPRHVYGYVDARSSPVAARREMEVLSVLLSFAVRWGAIDRHPIKGQVRLAGEKARERNVEPWEISTALALPAGRSHAVATAQAYIMVKTLTGLRRADMLRLRPVQPSDTVLRVTAHKTAKALEIELTPALRAACEAAAAARPVDISPWLFCTRRGQCYYDETTGQSNGWDSLWDRFMVKLLASSAVTERFGDRDLRAVAGRDASTLQHAQELLQHSRPETTQRRCRRAVPRVKPVK